MKKNKIYSVKDITKIGTTIEPDGIMPLYGKIGSDDGENTNETIINIKRTKPQKMITEAGDFNKY